jgi:hypothetical protein
MENRKAAKEVVLFAKKLWSQTKPKTVEVRRVKDDKTMEYGFPPVVIKTKAPIKFLVCAEYSVTMRIYHFAYSGQLVGAKNYEPPYVIKNEIEKKSSLIVKFPKKLPS